MRNGTRATRLAMVRDENRWPQAVPSVVLLMMTPLSQKLEPSANPARFRPRRRELQATPGWQNLNTQYDFVIKELQGD
jgi:hypothetical protein